MPPHLQRYFDKRDGRCYLYFRKRRHRRARLPQPIGSDEFWVAYKSPLGGKSEIGADRTIAGSVSAAIVAYNASSDWNAFSDGTRRLRCCHLESFRKRYGLGRCANSPRTFWSPIWRA